MAGKPDPKPAEKRRARPSSAGRIVEPGSTTAWLKACPRSCAVCGHPAETVHHIIPKGAPHYGDDVFGNFVGVSGSGSSGCHGALHGNPFQLVAYDDHGRMLSERRITQADARRAVGNAILRRPDVLLYIGAKLGAEAGAEFLRRVYHVTVAV